MSFLGTILPYLQVGIAVLLTAAILLQQRGSGLSATFGGEGNIYHTKRGLEKIIFISTVVLGVLFLLFSFLGLLLK